LFARSQNTLDGLEDVGVSKTHIQILKQFLILEGQIITDSVKIRGEKGVSAIPPNSIVSEPYYLHNLVRGVYKPQGDDFALSIQTNPQSKWGTEIDFETGNWKINYDFGDEKQYTSDITSLQKCFVNNVPLGVIYKLKKGENKILGLGKITKIEGSKFEIIPFVIDEKIENVNDLALNYAKDQILQKDFSAQGSETTTFVRAKQQVFRTILLEEYDGKCAFCGFGIEEYLNAAHIVPFKIMQKEDQMNSMHPSNGLLLCRLCDIAFENGDIIVQKDEIRPTENLIKKAQDNQSAKRWLSQLKKKLEIKNGTKYPPDEKYFTWKVKLLQNNQS